MKENPLLSSETGYIILSSEKAPRAIFIICITYNNTLRRFFKLKMYIVWKDTKGEGKVSLNCSRSFLFQNYYISCSSLST